METIITIAEGKGELFVKTCKDMNINVREMTAKSRPFRPTEYVVRFNEPIELFYLGLTFQNNLNHQNNLCVPSN